MVFKKLDERILSYLQKQSLAKQSTRLAISHEDLAKEMGTSREVISRVLKRMEEEGKIYLAHRMITLRK